MSWPIPFWNDAPGGSSGGGGSVATSGDSGLPKLESHIQTNTLEGWLFQVVEVPAAVDTLIVLPGRYYPTSTSVDGTAAFLTTIAALLNASTALAGTYTAVVDDDYDTSTGRVTLAATGLTSFSVTWLSTALQTALGYTGPLYGDDSYTSPNSSPHIWLPNEPRYPAMAPDGSTGMPVSDGRVLRTASFKTRATQRSFGTIDTLEFGWLKARKVWTEYESVVNESYKTFWLNGPGKGRRIRYYPARDTDSTYVGYRTLAINDMRVAPESRRWTTSALSGWHQGPIEVVNE